MDIPDHLLEEFEGKLEPQQHITEEIETLHAQAAAQSPGETQPRVNFPPYRSSVLRHLTKDLRHADPEGVELVAPVFGHPMSMPSKVISLSRPTVNPSVNG